MNQVLALYRSTVGKKAILAVTGFGLLVFVFAHMVGNLQIFPAFGGRDRLDGYARALRAVPVLLWGARAGLVGCFVVHLVLAAQLTRIKRAARPVRYRARKDLQATLASRTMTASGVVLALFVPIHLANLTFGTLHPRFVPLAAHDNVVALFRGFPASVLATGFYLVALGALGLHLAHGCWSLFQSLGIGPLSWGAGALRRLAQGVGVATVVGLVSVVVAVAAGFVR
jgi:succinate dehydrogenase / fumarate reductase cytochrome b subunit